MATATKRADELHVGDRIVAQEWDGTRARAVTHIDRDPATKWFPKGQVVVGDETSQATVRIFHPDSTVEVAL